MGELKEKIAKANKVKTSSIPNWVESLGAIIIAVIFIVLLSPFAAWFLPMWLLFGTSEQKWSLSQAKRAGGSYDDGFYTEYLIPPPYVHLPILLGLITLFVFYKLIKNYENYSPAKQKIINLTFAATIVMAFISAAMGLGPM